MILCLSLIYSCVPKFNSEILTEDLTHDLEFLASDSLKGRYPGSLEDSILLNFISDRFKEEGLDLFEGTGIQRFTFDASVEIGKNNKLTFEGADYSINADFLPTGYSSSDTLTAPVIFAGYGFDFSNSNISRNDYEIVNPTGKWVLILKGNPEPNNPQSPYSAFDSNRHKAMLAKDKGAAGVIFISGPAFDPMDNLSGINIRQTEVGIPCIEIKRTLADKLLSSINMSAEKVEKKLNKDNTVFSTEMNVNLHVITDIIHKRASSGNVIGILKGSNPELSDEYLVIGAHHDHLGMGGKGSSSRRPDTLAVHYGADDNASGVSSLLELVGKFKTLKPERSIIFVTFGAEEKGIIGSRYFTENSPVPLNKIIAMINIDMVGRMKPDSGIQIGGVGTSGSLRDILNDINRKYNFKLNLSSAGYGPSDHASFYAKDKPVLFFTTGAHKDYHTPDDKVDSLNIEALTSITKYICDVALHTANLDTSLIFTEAGPKTVDSKAYMGKVSLGIMPDVSAEDKNGLSVLAVTEGKPAVNGGIKRGDVIIAIDYMPVGDIYEYMFRLSKIKPGDAIIVTVKRGEGKLDLLIQL